MAFQGINEFPVRFDPDKDWPGVRMALMAIRQNVIDSLGTLPAPRDPSLASFTVTAAAFANIIQFVRTNADFYRVWWSPNANFKNAYPADIGDNGQWVDYTGKDAITRYYWVQAVNSVGGHTHVAGGLVGPKNATTLAVAGAVAPPVAPPQGDQLVQDNTTGFTVQNPNR